MRRSLTIHLLFFVALQSLALQSLAVQGGALTYLPRMDQAQWISREHVLSCTLIQPIPDLGRAVFQYSAGDTLRFYLESPDNPLEPGQATLTSRASTWYPQQPEQQMGIVKVVSGKVPIQLGKRLATHLLAELYKGKSPSFARKAWYAEDEPIEVAMSASGFRSAYASYRNCVADLLPVGFDQVERSKVHFAVDKYELDKTAREWLDILARYLTRATDVEQFYIDGHTDSTHTASYNVQLSKNRAEAVRDYLVNRGVSPNLLMLRYHGERFPVADNDTVEGRAENRRVTMRVELAVQPSPQVLAQR